MLNNICRACGATFVIQPHLNLKKPKKTRALLKKAAESGYCLECFCEISFGWIPKVTDSSLPASGTGLAWRQRCGKGRTDGG